LPSSSTLPGFISILPDKLLEKWRVGDSLTRLISCFTESPVDGSDQGILAIQAATAICQDICPVAPHVIADLPEVLWIHCAQCQSLRPLILAVAAIIAAILLIFGDEREGDESPFGFVERDARISTSQRVGVYSRKRAVQELLGSQSCHDYQPVS